MNKHSPIMDTLLTNVVSSRKRIRANDSSDDESQHEDDVTHFDYLCIFTSVFYGRAPMHLHC